MKSIQRIGGSLFLSVAMLACGVYNHGDAVHAAEPKPPISAAAYGIEPVPTEVQELRKEVARLKSENAELKSRISDHRQTTTQNDEYAVAVERNRKKKIAASKSTMERWKNELDAVYTNKKKFATVQERLNEIASLKLLVSKSKDEFEKISLPNSEIPLRFEGQLVIGQIGELGEQPVFQVSGPNEALVYLGFELVWISGIDTTGIVDGKSYEIKGVFKVTGTKTYQTPLSVKTIMHLERIQP